MDWSSVITAFIGLGGTLGGGLITYLLVGRKANAEVQIDGAKFDRNQIITTQQWLERETKFNDRIDMLTKRIDDLRADYEKRLDEKDKEISRLTTDNTKLTIQVRDLDHSVRNLQQVNTTAKDIKDQSESYARSLEDKR